MLGSGMLWGYLIGIFCTLATASPSTQAFRDELSQLNTFMQTYGLDSQMRFRLREFVHETVHLRDAEAQRALLSKLSPTMQGEVSLLVNRRWVAHVWYLRGADLGLVIDIAARLRAQIFAPLEFCPAGAMYIISRGMAIWAARTRRMGEVCGDDVLLSAESELQISFSAVAASYLWVFSMSGDQLHKALDSFPVAAAPLRMFARKWAVRRAVVRYAERHCFSKGQFFRGRQFPIYAKVRDGSSRDSCSLCSLCPCAGPFCSLFMPTLSSCPVSLSSCPHTLSLSLCSCAHSLSSCPLSHSMCPLSREFPSRVCVSAPSHGARAPTLPVTPRLTASFSCPSLRVRCRSSCARLSARVCLHRMRCI
jgi:hypothetical protein